MLWHEIFFVLTGVCSTIGYQWLFYQGAGGGGLSMITVLPSYIGMIFPLFKPSIRKRFAFVHHPKSTHKLVISACICDILGSILTAIGLFYTGSGLYQVLYSSVVVFTALISRVFLQTPISWKQWIAVVMVNVGLACSTGAGSLDANSGTFHSLC